MFTLVEIKVNVGIPGEHCNRLELSYELCQSQLDLVFYFQKGESEKCNKKKEQMRVTRRHVTESRIFVVELLHFIVGDVEN